MSFLRNHHSHQTDTSSLFDQTGFYSAFEKDLRHARREVIIESPFISISRTTKLLPIVRELTDKGVKVVINTRDPDEHEQPHSDYARLMIDRLQEAGAQVLYTVGHHRKLVIIDEHILWEGSLNILSHYDSCEIMRRSVSNKEALRMKHFINIDHYLG